MLGLARRVEWWLQILVTVCRGIVRRDSGGGLVTGIVLGLARRVEWWLQILVTVCRGIVRRDSGGGLVTGIVLGLARRVEWWLQILVTVCRGIVRRDSGGGLVTVDVLRFNFIQYCVSQVLHVVHNNICYINLFYCEYLVVVFCVTLNCTNIGGRIC